MGTSRSSRTIQAAINCRIASSWPTQVTFSSSGCARCNSIFSILNRHYSPLYWVYQEDCRYPAN